MTNDKDIIRVPFCCDYHDRYGDHCLFQYQTARPPKASDAARQILNDIVAAGAAIPSWNTKQRQRFETKILAAIDAALTTTRLEAVTEAQREAAEFFCHWLLRAYEAIHRDTSYEEGENLDGIAREINQVIGFAGYEPESAAREQLLAKKFSWNELHIEAEGSGE